MLVLLIIYIIFLVTEKSNKKTYNETETPKETTYITKGDVNMFEVGQFSNYVSPDENVNMVKMFFTVNNNDNNDIDMGTYLIHLADSEKNELGVCYTDGMNMYHAKDIFPSIVSANSSESGYIYCLDNGKTFEYLKITYATKGYIDENGKFAIDTNDIFVKIDN